MTQQPFAGDRKAPMRSPLAAAEKRFVEANVDRFPPWIETWHLTALTIVWTAGVLLFAWAAERTGSMHWLWGSSAMLFLQWFTDTFDGALGRRRGTGLVKWGFYADHLLDFFFMPAVFVGYAFLATTPAAQWMILVCGFLYAAMMVHSFLMFAATNEFKITFLGTGPTEIRLYFILLNCLVIFAGMGPVEAALPYAVAVFALAMTVLALSACRRLWRIDMQNKREAE